MLNLRRISLLQCAASFFLANASRGIVLLDSSHSRRQVADTIPTASSPPVESGRRLQSNSLGSSLPLGSVMVASSQSSSSRHLSGPSQPSPRLLVRRLGRGVGCSHPGRNRFRSLLSINARELLAVEYGLRHFSFWCPTPRGQSSQTVPQPWLTYASKGALYRQS